MNNKVVVIVPIKTVSKRVKNKNFRIVNKKPLYQFLLNKLKFCNFDEIYVDFFIVFLVVVDFENGISHISQDFPLNTVAISVASLPSVLSFASTKNQFLSIVSMDGVSVLFIYQIYKNKLKLILNSTLLTQY